MNITLIKPIRILAVLLLYFTFLPLSAISIETKIFDANSQPIVAEVIDLGLSVKWASWNIGASKPEEYGSYFSWGETSPKSDYSWNTYKFGNPPSKYNSTDNKILLDSEDDAAVVLWGGKWRMPTNDEEKELYDKCEWVYTQRNGINGYLVTGPNGNSIFLPAAGLYDANSTLSNNNSGGWYWSSNSLNSSFASGLYFLSSYVSYSISSHDKCDGHVIRPVYDDTGNTEVSTKRTIHVATAGTLPNYISESEMYIIEELTLTGELNGTDFRLLRDMAGCNYLGEMTQGKLKIIDMSNATIVAGGDSYLETSVIHSKSGTLYFGATNILYSSKNSLSRCLFAGCYIIENLLIPSSVTIIGDDAFFGCSGLMSVTIPNNVTSIGTWAFMHCSSLISITIPDSVTSLADRAFCDCSSLTSITIPNSVKDIGIGVFENCSGLSSITIPNSVASIGSSAFSGCKSLASIMVSGGNTNYDSRNSCNAIIETLSNTLIAGCMNTFIPNSVTSIGSYAFSSCSGLTSLSIPNSVTSIGEWAFYSCSGLTSMSIPNSVTSIGEYAFSNCSGLKDVISEIFNPFEINENVFSSDLYTTAKLTVPKGTKSAYLSTVGWNKFETILEGQSEINQEDTRLPAGYTAVEYIQAPKERYSTSQVWTVPNNLQENYNYIFEFTPLSWEDSYYGLMIGGNDISTTFPKCGIFKLDNGWGGMEKRFLSAFWNYDLATNRTSPGGNYRVYTGVRSKFQMHCKNYDSTLGAEIIVDNEGYATYTHTSTTTYRNDYSVQAGVYDIPLFTTIDGNTEPPALMQLHNFKVEDKNGNAIYDYVPCIRDNDLKVGLYDIVNGAFYYPSAFTLTAGPKINNTGSQPTTIALNIKATGNGSASYNGTTIRDNTSTFEVEEGTSVTITFTPDNGYRIKSVKVGSTDVTSNVSNNTYTISSISGNTSVEVVFEAIPLTTYTLSIKATGNGSASYDGTTIKNQTSTFTVTEGTSATITFTPDNGYRIKSVKVGSTDITSSVSNNSYTISSISGNTSVEVEFEAIPPTTYTLSIKATGNGSASYDGTTIKNQTSTFTVTEGSDLTISFTPDNGYQIKSVVVDGNDVTSYVYNDEYTIGGINSDTTVEVEFEAIPPTTYTLSIKATGNGSATYDGTTIRGKTSTFTVNEGISATITFSSDNGYRIKSVKVNNSDVISSISNNSYTINSINRDTEIEVEFEAIPTVTYSLSITATGNGSASYEGTVVKNKTTSFTVNEGANATITFTPDNGYRIKSVKVNNTDVTSSVSNNNYTISNINRNTTVEVEFEVIPPTVYTLSIKATGNGSVTYDGTSVRGKTSSFNVNGGSSVTITISPDDGNRIKSVTVNSSDVTSRVMNNSYTISNIAGNTAVEVVFEEIISELTNEGVYYKVVSEAQQTVKVVSGDYGLALNVPASFTAKDKEWKVVGVEADVLSNPELAAIIWNPEVALNGTISNPNLLLYVKDMKYAPNDINNVIVNGVAENIMLQDAESDNNFYCPQEFTAKRISFIHRYNMKTGFKTCQGWETIVLPFNVTTILSATGTEIVPYTLWKQGGNSRPFWLYSMNSDGWKAESGIKANIPYIISMPNNDEYDASYNLSGDIQFMSSNVQVSSSDHLSASKCGNKQLVPNYQNKVASQDIYALNVNNQWNTNTATETEGSAFIRSLRQVRPFEAYMTIEGNAGARRVIPIFEDGGSTGIPTIPVSIDRRSDAIYNLNGQRVNSMSRGIYIQNGKKIIKK